jgi:6,7-dimethyl-8-ribityllumazine synthase
VAQEIKGTTNGHGLRIGIIVSRFNEFVTSRLLTGAREALATHGVSEDDITVIWVPGSFELAPTARKMARKRDYHAIVCLGVVIKGETDHYHHVANEAARGIGAVANDSNIPIIFGVLTPNDTSQALARAGGDMGNRGYDSILSALEMVNLNKILENS